MNRSLVAAVMLATIFAATGLAGAQPYQPRRADPAMSYTIVKIIPNSQSDLAADTRPDTVSGSPGCGPASPQGGKPNAVTWGDCP